MTFEGFNDSKRLLDQFRYFKMLDSEKISVKVPRPCKRPLNNGNIIPIKKRQCDKCKGVFLYDV